MDIPREKKAKKGKYIWGGIAIVAVVLVTVALRNLKPAAPSVDRATVWVDQVERGTMVRQVRGPGNLVPEQMRWISAVTAGRVERIHILPGTEVDSQTIILELENPDVQVQALEAQRQLTNAEAQLVDLRSRLETQLLNQQGVVATVQAQHSEAMRNARNNEELARRNLIPEAELETAKERAQELAVRLEVEKERLKVFRESMDEQLAVQREQVERLRAIAVFQEDRVRSMVVKAGVAGVLSELGEQGDPLQDGQWVNPGDILARVVKPGRLKAEVRIPETQAVDLSVGQRAFIDTRNDTIQGRVVRIDPAAQGGTVTVDVTFEEALPPSARPDLSIQGTIEIERLDDVLYVGRPAYGQANSTVGLFKLVEGGNYAVRANVRLGRSSVNTIEILDGLQEGDEVVLSDMSQWDSYDRVRLR